MHKTKNMGHISLQVIVLFQNNVNFGTFPFKGGNCINLTSLGLSFNKSTKSIPFTLGMSKSLTNVNLHSNMFNGTIPSFTECRILEALRLE
jgi:hypothetical protein